MKRGSGWGLVLATGLFAAASQVAAQESAGVVETRDLRSRCRISCRPSDHQGADA